MTKYDKHKYNHLLPFKIKKEINDLKLRGKVLSLKQTHSVLAKGNPGNEITHFDSFFRWHRIFLGIGHLETASLINNRDMRLQENVRFTFDSKPDRVYQCETIRLDTTANQLNLQTTDIEYLPNENRRETTFIPSLTQANEMKKWISVYDYHGKLISKEIINVRGVLQQKAIYEYNHEGRITHKQSWDTKNDLSWIEVSEYNESGEMEKQMTIMKQGNSQERETLTTYEYDASNRKVQQTTVENGEMQERQNWEYADDGNKTLFKKYSGVRKHFIEDRASTILKNENGITIETIEEDFIRKTAQTRNYNDFGLLTSSQFHDLAHEDRNRLLNYQYQFDEKMNWVKRWEYLSKGKDGRSELQAISRQEIGYW